MSAFCYKFISGCSTAKSIKIDLDLTKLLTAAYCDVFLWTYSW